MNKKLKIALISCSSEQGFAMPIAIGLGLVMILIAATLLIRSQGDQVTASAQKATSRSLSAAEIGINRYQSLINNNRVIATYSRTGTPGWATAVDIPGINTCSGSTTTGSTVVTSNATTDWQNIDPDDLTKGQFKLINYIYSPSDATKPNQPPGTGTLTVEGRVNQSGSGNTATNTLSTANTKLVVNIPINFGSLNTVVPALWVKNSTITDMGNDKVNGNILINSCPPATGATSANLYDPSTQKVIANPVSFPDTPALPPARADGSASYYTLIGSPFGGTFPRPEVPLIPAKGKIPAVPAVPADEPADDGYYHYLINNLVDNGNGEITISPNKKVIFHVQGNIDLGGNPDINKTPSNTPNQLQIYGNTYTNTSKTTTKYGCIGLNLLTTCPTLKVAINGTGTIKAFIHAPDATGSVKGGGNTNGNLIGSIWIKDWDSSSGNSKVKIDAAGNYGDYLVSQNMSIPPLISPISSWQRLGVTP